METSQFFKKLFYNGLGELLYKNKLDIKYNDFLDIQAQDQSCTFNVTVPLSLSTSLLNARLTPTFPKRLP